MAVVVVCCLALARGWGSDEYLHVRMPSANGVDFRIPFSAGTTGIDAAAAAARHLNVHPAYVVLWKNQAALGGAPDGPQTHVDREPLARVDNSALRLRSAEHGQLRGGDTLTLALRPLRGDHLHNGIAIYYKGQLLDVPTDRPVLAVGNNLRDGEDVARCTPDLPGGQQPTHAAAGQGQPPLFRAAATPPEAGSETYIGERPWEGNHVNNVFPHFGVHSGHDQWFGMGLIHVHPATSWQWYRGSEGLGASLGAFLEQVGIWVWEAASSRYPQHTPAKKAEEGVVVMDFPPGTRLAGGGVLAPQPKLESNYPGPAARGKNKWSHCDYPTRRVIVQNDATHEWRLHYWPHVNSSEVHTRTSRFDRLWLHHNQAMITLAFEEKSYSGPPRKPPPRTIAYLQGDADAFRARWAELYKGEADAGAAHHDSIPHDASSPEVLGFDGGHYPMPNLPGAPPWKAVPPKNEAAVRAAAMAAAQGDGAAARGRLQGSGSATAWGGGDGSAQSTVPLGAAFGMAAGFGLLASTLTFFGMQRHRGRGPLSAYTTVSADGPEGNNSSGGGVYQRSPRGFSGRDPPREE